MNVRVLFFAVLAQRTGVRDVTLELPGGASVSDAMAVITARHPAVGELRGKLALAVNHEYVGPEHRLSDRDELALIPPVSGG